MKNINNQKHHCRHQISSFNCLRPPSYFDIVAANNNRRSIEDASNIRCFVASAQHHKSRNSDWPLSPRIGCMGQIKRSSSHNSRIRGNKKLFQIKKMFTSSNSSSSLMTISTKVKDGVCRRGITIADTMDTPLPLTLKRRSVIDGADLCTNLWNRRRKGEVLHFMETEQIKLNQIEHLRRNFSSMAAENFAAQV